MNGALLAALGLVILALWEAKKNASTGGEPDSADNTESGWPQPIGSIGASADVNALQKIADAIAQFEGSKSTDRNHRNNNPGNLEPPDGSADFFTGQIGTDGPYAVFSTWDAGFAALLHDLQIKATKHPSWTLSNLLSVWLGNAATKPQITAEGNPFTYADFVAKKLGVSTSTTLAEIAGGNS